MTSIVYANNFDVSKLSIGTLKVLDSGAKQALTSYSGEKFIIQTAVNMHIPFGLNVFTNKDGSEEYSIDVSYRDNEKRPEVAEFLDMMTALDDRMIQEGVKNSRAWFKTDPNPGIIRAFYSPCVKYATDKEGNRKPYPPTTKFKIKKINGLVETKFYNTNGSQLNKPVLEMLPKGAYITLLAQCTGVWLAGGKFGLSWRTNQIVVHSVPNTIKDFAIRLPSTGIGSVSATPAVEDETEDDDDNTAAATGTSTTVEDDSAFTTPATTTTTYAPTYTTTDDQEESTHTVPAFTATVPSVISAVLPGSTTGNDTEPLPLPVKKAPIVKKKVVVPSAVKK